MRTLTTVKSCVKNTLNKQISSTHFNLAITMFIGTAKVIGLKTYNAGSEFKIIVKAHNAWSVSSQALQCCLKAT